MRRMMILSVVVASVFVLFAIADTAVAWNIQPVPSITDKKIGKFDPWYKKLKRALRQKLPNTMQSPNMRTSPTGSSGVKERIAVSLSPGFRNLHQPPCSPVSAGMTPRHSHCSRPERHSVPQIRSSRSSTTLSAGGSCSRTQRSRLNTGRKYGNAPLTLVLYRSHFGDMQFLHSMASSEQERAGETKQKIMAWAEFMYKIALGEITRGTSIKKTGIPGIDSLFTYRYDTVQTLFVSDAPREYKDDENLHLFAMGVLIHMVSDSFSDSHVERDEQLGQNCRNVSGKHNPGWVRSFHVYTLQDSAAHSEAESDRELAYKIYYFETNIVDVGQTIMEYYSRKAPWEELKGYLDCVYDLADPNAPAGPGSNYQKKDNRTIDPNIIPSS